MDAQLLVIIAGLVLVAVVVVSLVALRGYSGRFRFDTQNGTRPRASEGEGNTAKTAFKSRFTGLIAGVGAAFALILARLWSMQMVSSDYYEQLAEENRTRTVTTPADRGRILDRNGTVLVGNRPSLVVTAYADAADDEVLVRHLANLLGLPYMAVRRNIQDNTEGAQSAHTVATDVSRRAVAYIQEHASEFEGVEIAQRSERQYPYRTLAAQLLGYTGTATQEQLIASNANDDPGAIHYESGDIVGQAGIELQYESVLQGIRGEQTVRVDANGNVTGQSAAVEAQPGSDIMLTIDLKVQQACEDGLAHAFEIAKQAGYPNAGAGACLCIDCTTGEILGLANAPSYDPSSFVGGISQDVWDQLNDAANKYPLMNRAVAGQYMSASTIKPLTAFAALNYGVMTPDSIVTCTGYWTGLGEEFGQYCWDHDGHGPMDIESAIVYSCDPMFYEIGKDFYYSDNPEGMQDTYRAWGLGSACGVDLGGEAAGRVPDAAWKKQAFSSYSSAEQAWNPGDMTNLAIGQGDILVTPLQIAQVYCGIANGGTQMVPHLLKSVVARDGEGDALAYEPRQRLAVTEDGSYMDLVHRALQGVIYEESESCAAHFSNLYDNGAQVLVAGKSGTGEKSGEDPYGWFVVYAPADNPRYVVACLCEQGGFGANSAMYAVRDVLGAIYDSPDDAAVSTSDSTR